MVRKSVLSDRIAKGLADPISEKEKLLVVSLRTKYEARYKKKRKKQMSRENTLETINKVMDKGVELLGSEPIGFVLLYPDAAFLKATWKNAGGSHEDIAQALMDASLDELSKVDDTNE